jgi:invasion protein IalB
MIKRFTMLSIMLACIASPAAAQSNKDTAKPVAPPAVPATPERTTASFGDWILRCESPAAPAKRACEVALILTAQGQTAAIAQIALGKAVPPDGRPMTIVLPHNISLLSKPRIVVAKSGGAPVELAWQRCTPGACFASVSLPADAATNFGAQTEPGKISYKNAGEQEVELPLSFRGLAQALEALAKEP